MIFYSSIAELLEEDLLNSVLGSIFYRQLWKNYTWSKIIIIQVMIKAFNLDLDLDLDLEPLLALIITLPLINIH